MDKKKKMSGVIKWIKKLGILLVFIIIFISLLLFASISWMFKTWKDLTMSELVYHLQSPIEGTDSAIIISYIFSCLLAAFLLSGIILFLYKMFQGKKMQVLMGAAILCVSMAAISVGGMWNRLEISAYVGNKSTYSSFIDDNYVDPSWVDLTFPEQKRNLIYIYLESMETTYSDKENGGDFDQNVIPELTELAQNNEDFSGDSKKLNGGVSLDGTGWTAAAMFAQVSGLPLIIPGSANSMGSQQEFFPVLNVLGDVLEEEGYQQSLLIGSDAVFGGREQLFSQHGNYNIWDYTYSIQQGELPSDYRVFWGYEDKKLFEFAKKHLEEISASSEPFNLTMLTVDTHFEDGYVCEDCPATYGGNQYANVMACSSKRVSEFVKWVQQQEFYENTTIVISGDHPTMDSDFCENVADEYQRKVYTTYINAASEPANGDYREYSTLDNFPTTVASLGVSISGNRLGLGTNLFSGEPTILERYGKETVNLEMNKKSQLIEKLAEGLNQENMDVFSAEDVVEEETEEEDTAQEETVIQPEAITGEVAVTEYDYNTGNFKVIAGNFSHPEEIQSVRCAVWSKEDQSDLIWYEATGPEDGVFVTNVWASDFGFREGTYQVHVYGVTSAGELVALGGSEGYI